MSARRRGAARSVVFFNDTATTEIYTLSLHDALPISTRSIMRLESMSDTLSETTSETRRPAPCRDRKSTRLNSSHSQISYAVFCLKKKKEAGANDLCLCKRAGAEG